MKENIEELNQWIDANLFDGGKFVGIMKHGLWYRPNAQGYTNNFMEAGRFTRDEAKKHEQLNCEDNVTVHEFPVRDYTQPAYAFEVLKKCAEKMRHGIVGIGSPMTSCDVASTLPKISQGWVVGMIGKPSNFDVESETLELAICLFAKKLFSETNSSGGTALGSELFQRMNDGVPEQYQKLNVEVWTPTPWMIDVLTTEREQEIRNWCNLTFGRECSTIHGQEGFWQQGRVTMMGYCWFGFSAEALMQRFIEKFPSPPNPKRHLTEEKPHQPENM